MFTVHHHEPPYSVGYFIGSLAKGSINRTLAQALIRLAPDDLEFTEIPIRDLPLYNHDCDADYPSEARALKQSIESVDAVLFVTPEYNRAIPGGLKNAIDWASRPWGENSFEGKPSAVIGGSIGAIGTAVAQQNLGNSAEAERLFSSVAERGQGEHAARARFMLGEVLYARREYVPAIREFRKVMFGFDTETNPQVAKWQAKAGFEAGQCAGVLASQQQNRTERSSYVDLAQKFFQYVITRHPETKESEAATEQLRKYGS